MVLCALVATSVGAQPSAAPISPPQGSSERSAPDPQRYELAGFPIIAGNTDIGVQFGGALTITRYDGAIAPYLWNLDVLLTTSLKDQPNGLRFVQQSHVLRLDLPHLLGGRLRLDTRGSFERTINDGYYGLGNSGYLPAAVSGISSAQRYQYLFEEARVRSIARIHTGTPFDIALVTAIRYVAPQVYPNSKLAEDVAAGHSARGPTLYGMRANALFKLGGGVMYDTRDSEFVTRRGIFYQLGVAGTLGSSSENIRYGETGAVLAHYVQLPGVFILAARVVASFQFGQVPFYDLAQGGVFEPQRLLGSESGVRGVPLGRYTGAVKAIANLELRAIGPRFRFIGQRLRLGTTTFLDVGRLWGDYSYDSAHATNALGLKYGIGGGAFLQWGDAAIFRVEVAYSPDAESENPTLPIGIYVADGLMF